MANEGPVTVVGAGTLGRQIALQLAAHGTEIRLVDRSEEVLSAGIDWIVQESARLADSGELPESGRSAPDRVSAVPSLSDAVAGSWLVIEAIPEQVPLKQELFRELSMVTSPDTILATNSSSFKSRLLAEYTDRPERLMNAHFYNVPWRRSGVELMTCGATDPALIEKVRQYLRGSGLVPVVVNGESTGFIYNRIWRAMKKESLKVVAEGLATPEDVDRLACLCWGIQIGPFALMDQVGLDVVLDIERHYANESGDPNDEPPAMLYQMVEEGRLGRKTGEGFFKYPDPPFERPGWPRDDID